MHSSKLFKIIESLSNEDWKRLNRFVLGHEGVIEEVLNLFNYLSKYKKKLDSRQLNIHNAHQNICPKKTRKHFRNIMSRLTKVLEDYLRWNWLFQHKQEYDLCLLKALNNRGLYHLFDLKASQLNTKLKKSSSTDIWAQLQILTISHISFFSNNPIKSIKGGQLLMSLSKSLIHFTGNLSSFYRGVLEYYGEITNTDFSDDLKRLEQISNNEHSTDISATLNHLVLLNRNKVPQSFQYLYNRLTKEENKLSLEIRAAILTSLIHYAYEEYKSGSSNTANEILALNEYGITSGLLLVNQKINTTRFVNIVNAACACGRFDKAEEFIEQYNSLLEPGIRKETIQISSAQILFYQSDYSTVIDLLKDAYFHLFMHNMRVRWLLICAYFMEFRQEIEFMESMIRNYNGFIKTNKDKMSLSNFKASMNLSNVLRALLKDPSKDRLEKELNEADEIVFRFWIRNLDIF